MYYYTIRKMDTKSKLGKRIIRALISEEKQKQLSVRLKDRSRTRMINEYCNQREANLKPLFQTCLKHISPVTKPPVLISQIPHPRGSMLNRLFDGHPAIYAYPDELLNAVPAEIPWSEIDSKDDPQRWIEFFFEYFNPPNIPQRFNPDPNHKGALPFVFLPFLQKQIFKKYLNTIKLITPRDVFDAYMTACFGAWLNYQNHSQFKEFVTVSSPSLVTLKENLEGFFNIYPDGRLISLVQNPHNWYRSALQEEPEKFEDVNRSVVRWKKSIQAALWAKERYANRTCLIRVEDLLNKTEPVMQHLAEFLGIQYHPNLLIPTFNGYPISVDDSFKTAAVDITNHHSKEIPTLSSDQSKIIAEMTKAGYLTALKETVSF